MRQCLHPPMPSPLAAQPSLTHQSHRHLAQRPGAPTCGRPYDRVVHLLMLPTGVDAGARGPSSVRREYPTPSGVGGARPCLHRGFETSPTEVSTADLVLTALPYNYALVCNISRQRYLYVVETAPVNTMGLTRALAISALFFSAKLHTTYNVWCGNSST